MCVTWSRTGYYLASASENGDICLWNVLENRVQARLQVEWPVTRISLSRWAGLPNQRWHVAVSFAGMSPMVYDFNTQKRYSVHLFVLGASCVMMWRCWGGWGCEFGRVWRVGWVGVWNRSGAMSGSVLVWNRSGEVKWGGWGRGISQVL